LENNGVEQRGLCGELIDKDIEDEEVDIVVAVVVG